jgi:hypothetical protein
VIQPLGNQRLLDLLRSIAKDLRISTESIGESFFMKAFSIANLQGQFVKIQVVVPPVPEPLTGTNPARLAYPVP